MGRKWDDVVEIETEVNRDYPQEKIHEREEHKNDNLIFSSSLKKKKDLNREQELPRSRSKAFTELSPKKARRKAFNSEGALIIDIDNVAENTRSQFPVQAKIVNERSSNKRLSDSAKA